MTTDSDVARLCEVAGILLPGDDGSPAATDLPDLDELVRRALVAVSWEAELVTRGLELLPAELSWESLREYSLAHPVEFELMATVVSGAYFMSPTALDSIGYSPGPRRAPSIEQVVDELGEGLLDPVLDRGSILRAVP